MSGDQDIRRFLAGEGYGHPQALQAALEVLDERALTREGKQRMADSKLDAAREALTAALILTCSSARCQEEARGTPERRRIPAEDRTSCEVCAGSDNQHAVDGMVKRAQQRGVKRLVVIGGSPSTREELSALLRGRLELKAIDGTMRRTSQQAREDMAWAQLVLIWGSTELAHRVSMLYTRGPGQGARVVTVPRRGIVALAQAVERTLA
jgi:phosphohistidine phosphatase SixA